MALCTLTDVKKDYRMGEVRVPALRGVSVAIEPGEFTVFAGPSGSGKTTLLNLVGLLDVPTSGSVEMEGQDVLKLSQAELGALRARRIGFIFQSFNLIPVLSAFENVALALRLAGHKGGDRKERVTRALSQVGLGDLMDRRPSQLSGGQQQRVAIARALVKDPALVIADEPTANLDSKTGQAILDIMRQMNEEGGATFLFSTHDDMVMQVARRVVHIHDGVVIEDEHRTQPPRSGAEPK
ncbi:MAG: ABC transporter ATP-binding protein [Alphaproteobacteria bacterium]|nr:ABC transporter ATP-binding protein [Alphaproteobacteria bacterium]